MVASRIAALSHPMTSMSEEIFRLSILDQNAGAQLPKDAAIDRRRPLFECEYPRHSQNQPLVRLH
jgi:hypothetical protein